MILSLWLNRQESAIPGWQGPGTVGTKESQRPGGPAWSRNVWSLMLSDAGFSLRRVPCPGDCTPAQSPKPHPLHSPSHVTLRQNRGKVEQERRVMFYIWKLLKKNQAVLIDTCKCTQLLIFLLKFPFPIHMKSLKNLLDVSFVPFLPPPPVIKTWNSDVFWPTWGPGGDIKPRTLLLAPGDMLGPTAGTGCWRNCLRF